MKIKTLPKAVAYSLGAHGLALALIVMANANAVTPRKTIENVPFIKASLIYAMNGQDAQKTTPPLHRAAGRTVRTVNKPMEPRTWVSEGVKKEESVATTVVERVRAEQAGEMKTEAPVSLYLPSLGSDDVGQIASRGETPGNHLQAVPQGGSGKAEAGQMILPRYLNAARPSYPLMARMRGYEGMVLLAVQVLTDGRAGEVRIKKSSGYALLDQSALNAVRAWRFEPARKMDAPLVMTVDIPVRFSLNEPG
jgi:TonB family protein